MCEFCGPPVFAADEFALTERPAQRLVGLSWDGTNAEAASGAIGTLLGRVQEFAAGLGDAWIGPIVAISWSDRPEGFRYFAGVETSVVRAGLVGIDCAASRFATGWHDENHGEVVDHYERMLWWMSANGHRWDKQALHHREEYPLHTDFSAVPALRLMLPLKQAVSESGSRRISAS